jgi:hypothetical protein
MDYELHDKKNNGKPNRVQDGTLTSDSRRLVSLLRDVIIESQNRSGEIERSVQNISQVVSKREIFRFRWYIGPISS